jgi:hypothetical protein
VKRGRRAIWALGDQMVVQGEPSGHWGGQMLVHEVASRIGRKGTETLEGRHRVTSENN